MIQSLSLVRSGMSDRWLQRWIGLSKTRMSEGSTTSTTRMPMTMPLAITSPRSGPSPRRMAQSAKKPATVVVDDPDRETNAPWMALAIASRRSSNRSFSSSYRSKRKIE